jgi:AcrR family transcriptional regulator
MRDIAAEAGVSPAAIYRYFPSQDELFMEAFLKDLTSIGLHFKWRLEKKIENPLEEFATSVVDHLIYSESTFQMVSYFMIKGNMPENILTKFNALQAAFMDKITEVLEMAGVPKEDRILSHVFFASIMGILMTFRNYPGREKEEIKNHIHRLALTIADIFKENIASREIKETA